MDVPILELLKAEGNDKRGFNRQHFDRAILVWPKDDVDGPPGTDAASQCRAARAVDVSLTGIFFYSEVPYAVGTVVVMQISFGVLNYELEARVARTTTKQLPSRIVYGCGSQFVSARDITRFLPVLARYLKGRATAQSPASQGGPSRFVGALPGQNRR